MHDLLKLEKEGWKALSTPGDAGKRFYRSILHDDIIMVFPGGLLLKGKEAVLESISPQAWQAYQLEKPQVILFSENVKGVVYQVTAHHGNDKPYEAIMSSIYIFSDGKWQLIFHQQTPK